MSEENTQANDGAAPPPAAAERPDWAPAKFWDGESGALRAEDLAKSYVEMERLIGARVGDLGVEARRKLAAVLPDELKATWLEEERTRLAADPEFLGPLEEAWKSQHLPKAPDDYAVPERQDNQTYVTDHPLYAAAVEFAKKHHLGQEAFAELMDLGFQYRADYETPPSVEDWKAAIPDIDTRAKAVYNRLAQVGGDAVRVNRLIALVRDPDAFLALEAGVNAGAPKPLALEPGHADGQLTREQLKQMQADPRYLDPAKRDMDFVRKIERGWVRLENDRV